MSLEEFLIEDEEILAKIKASGTLYLATNKRVLKYRKELFGESFDDLAYKHITSLSHKKKQTYLLYYLVLF